MDSVAALEDRLSDPSPALVADLKRLSGDILVLGAGGKLGPSLTRLALRAVGGGKSVTAVSRFGDAASAKALADAGTKIVSADITDEAALWSLPDTENVVFLVGSKFGSTGREADTWYTNAYLPGRVAERFKHSRIVALSTGNVYAFMPVMETTLRTSGNRRRNAGSSRSPAIVSTPCFSNCCAICGPPLPIEVKG